MKRYNYLLGLLFCGSLVFSACSDDEEPAPAPAPETPSYPELNVGTDRIDVKKGETFTQTIADGGGDYRAISLNPEIVSATVDGQQLMVSGLEYGETSVVVSDRGGAYKDVPVMVYLYDEIKTDLDGSLSITMLMGKPTAGTFRATQFNAPLAAVSSDEETATVSVSEDGEVTVIGKSVTGETPVTITLTDAHGLTATVTVDITNQEGVYSDEELEAIKARTESCVYYNEQEVRTGSFLCGENADLYITGYGRLKNFQSSCCFVSFDEEIDVTVGKKEGGQLVAKGYTPACSYDACDFEVIKVESDKLWAVYSLMKDGSLLRGYMILPR